MADEGSSGSNSLPPFLAKTYEMVDDPSTNPAVSWSSNSKTFVVWNPPEFSRDLLPRFFKHNNFSSFIRQLNTYGFRKVDPEQWEFANEGFVRGQPDLMKTIHRRKPVHSHSGPSQASLLPLTESERKGYKDDIEKLKSDKESLNTELQRYKDEQQGLKNTMTAMIERVQNVEKQHMNMLSSLAHKLRRPAFSIDDTPQVEEAHVRKRRFRESSSCSIEETSLSQIPAAVRNLDDNILLTFNRELLERMESSLTFWEKIVSDAPGEGLALPNSSSFELVDSGSRGPSSPCISYTQLNVDVGIRFSEIDMNSDPRTSSVSEVRAQNTGAGEKSGGTAADGRTGVNDMFWEQFLTENPGSNDDSLDSNKTENRADDKGKYWWNMRSVNNLTETIGHLTPAERT